MQGFEACSLCYNKYMGYEYVEISDRFFTILVWLQVEDGSPKQKEDERSKSSSPQQQQSNSTANLVMILKLTTQRSKKLVLDQSLVLL